MYPHDTGNIKEQKWLDSVFDKYDTNKSGQLEKGQLIELLRRVSPGVEVSDADEAYVLAMVDLSNTGRSPLGTAYHAPLSTLHSLPASRLTTYYSPLTTYHLPLVTYYVSILRSEALAACATWKSELASGNVPSQKTSMCTML